MATKTAKGKRLNPFQAARTRPAVVLGDCSFVEKEDWVAQPCAEPGEPLIVFRNVHRNQGLIRIFTEAISNAIDNVWRSSEAGIPMKKIRIEIDRDVGGLVTVYNDGAWIPVVKQEFEYEDYRTKKTSIDEVYPAEFYFGEMYAGTNFENDEDRKTSGRNGMGAKAIVIFSNATTVEHTDPEAGKKFVQTFGKAGETRTEPSVTAYRAKTGYTKISFVPDFEFFGYPGCDDDFVATIKKLAYDTAVVTGVPVTFSLKENEEVKEEKMLFKTMKPYINLYFPGEKSLFVFTSDKGDECAVVQRSSFDDPRDEPLHQSWINGILTSRGGKHVDAWKTAILMKIVRAFNATRKENEPNANLKDINSFLMLFIKSERSSKEIDFDSQAKEYLTKPVNFELSSTKKAKDELAEQIDVAVKKMLKWSFVKVLKERLDNKVAAKLEKEDNKTKLKLGEKVKDARLAGANKKGADCTFWICEGDSAARFVERLVSKLPNGYDLNGWTPIRGKSQNAEKWTVEQLFDNQEFKNIKEALGLKIGMKAVDIPKLRYGRVMIASDADVDGDHIRGLLVCFFFKFWPEICMENFIWFFPSMVTKVTIGKKQIPFYNEDKSSEYVRLNKIDHSKVTYYKGLAKHEVKDVTHYLENPQYINLVMNNDARPLMDMAFLKKGADLRKKWMIERYFSVPNKLSITESYRYDGKVPIRDFIDGPFLIYCAESTRRGIPGAIDGLKHSQRQALFGMLELNQKISVSVEELAGRIKNLTKYHHGAVSLQKCIADMAQGFPGSNNIPLFHNGGEFGTRIGGGKDQGAARYISTCLEEITRKIFRPEDDPVLEYEIVEGAQVQPVTYVPIIPMAVINGTSGISTGWNTNIPNYDPLKVVEWIETYLEMVEDDPSTFDSMPDLAPLAPWYRGFKGENILDENYPPKFWISRGIIHEEARTTARGNKSKLTEWHITELPVGLWTEKAKEKLDEMWDPPKASKKAPLLSEEPEDLRKDVNDVHFVIRPTKDFTPDLDTASNPIAKLLIKRDHLTQMNFLDSEGVPTNFASVEDIMIEHAKKRLATYETRKAYWLDNFNKLLEKSKNKYIYVKAVVEGELDMHQSDEDLEAAMSELGLTKLAEEGKTPSYEYLLSMQMRSMSVRKLEELRKEADTLNAKIKSLHDETPITMWRKELVEFKEAYAKFLRTRKEQ